MLGVVNLPAYIAAVVVLVMLPGPNSLFCMTVAGRYGVRKSRYAMAGTFLGNGILIAASSLGAGVLLKNYPVLFDGMKLAGGLYLFYFGVKMLLAAWRGDDGGGSVGTVPEDGGSIFRRALLIALLNPKGLLFFPSIMVQFVDLSYGQPLVGFAVLGLVFQTASLVFLNIAAPLADGLAAWFRRYPKAGRAGRGGVGMVFLAFAAKLWTAAV